MTPREVELHALLRDATSAAERDEILALIAAEAAAVRVGQAEADWRRNAGDPDDMTNDNYWCDDLTKVSSSSSSGGRRRYTEREQALVVKIGMLATQEVCKNLNP